MEKLAIDNKEFQVPIDERRTRQNKNSNPSVKMIQTAENYQDLVRAFTDQHEVNSTVKNDENRNNPTLTFPEYISHVSQVGVVTSALVGGATQMIAGGVRVSYSQGAALGSDVLVGQLGDSGNREMREDDKNVLYLI